MINVSFCLSAVYGSLFLFSLLSTVECGGCTTLGQSLFGSAGRFNSPTEVVGDCPEGCDLHETDHGSPLRLCPDTSLLEILNITRTRTFPTQRSPGSQISGRRHVGTSLLLRHSPSPASTSPSSASDHAILPDPRGPPELHPGRSGQTPVRADIPQGRLGPGALRPHPDPPG